jgi:hypothetical protein
MMEVRKCVCRRDEVVKDTLGRGEREGEQKGRKERSRYEKVGKEHS